ncbi:MAG TPA: hypothetical protein VK727_07485 [Steroidobacteraceae bacterium]|nr:hypothetical protein [Steroidobacteraceae bacterium]
MVSYGKFAAALCLLLSAFAATESFAQQSDTAVGDVQKQLLSLYQTAKATADGKDIVTAGAVLVLQKDHLVMTQVDQAVATTNIYKNGAITQDGLAKVVGFFNRLQHAGGQDAAVTTREFVTGEKFWVTGIMTKPDGVTFALMSDPINDQRYKATLKFPFPTKGVILSPDDTAALVAEVVKIDAPEASSDQGSSQQGSGGQGAKAPADTKTIALGQTRDQVVATFGVPTKVVKLGIKEIDFFPDMKVTFQHDKVTNVE